MYPSNQRPSLVKHWTQMPYRMSSLLQDMQGTEHPNDPSILRRTMVMQPPFFRWIQVDTLCAGTPCLRASFTHLVRRRRSAHMRCVLLQHASPFFIAFGLVSGQCLAVRHHVLAAPFVPWSYHVCGERGSSWGVVERLSGVVVERRRSRECTRH